jgi:UDP-N-acetylmuramate dehydrogenase
MLDQRARRWLRQLLGQGVVFDEPMARHTAIKIGGPADGLATPQSLEQLKALVQWAQQNNIPYMVVGGGTNLLVKDGGIRGVVIRLNQLAGQVQWEEKASQVQVTVGVGTPTKRLCVLALRHGWQGMNFALGIPGALGGAIVMNAGTAHGTLSDVLAAVTVLTGTGDQQRLAMGARTGAYRQMNWPEQAQGQTGAPLILLTAEVVLRKGNRQQVFQEARQLMQARAAKQPTWQPSAGCFFKNPAPHTPAGRLIDQAGLKGVQVGDAQVAVRHANFIVNRGQATAADVMALAEKIQTRVRKQFGIELVTEVRIVGEEAHT